MVVVHGNGFTTLVILNIISSFSSDLKIAVGDDPQFL
jgi:hypothetical protein